MHRIPEQHLRAGTASANAEQRPGNNARLGPLLHILGARTAGSNVGKMSCSVAKPNMPTSRVRCENSADSTIRQGNGIEKEQAQQK